MENTRIGTYGGIEEKLQGIKLHNTLQSPQINSVRMRNHHFFFFFFLGSLRRASPIFLTLNPHLYREIQRAEYSTREYT